MRKQETRCERKDLWRAPTAAIGRQSEMSGNERRPGTSTAPRTRPRSIRRSRCCARQRLAVAAPAAAAHHKLDVNSVLVLCRWPAGARAAKPARPPASLQRALARHRALRARPRPASLHAARRRLCTSVKPLGFNFERNFNGIPGAVRARAPRPCPCRPPRTERPRRPPCVRARRAGLLGRAGGQPSTRPPSSSTSGAGRSPSTTAPSEPRRPRRPRSPPSLTRAHRARIAAAAVCVPTAPNARMCVS